MRTRIVVWVVTRTATPGSLRGHTSRAPPHLVLTLSGRCYCPILVRKKLRLREGLLAFLRPQGRSWCPTWGLVSHPGPHITITWGPTQAFLTPLVTECNQISLGSPAAEAGGDLGVPHCPPLLYGHEEGPREGEGLPEQRMEVGFQKPGIMGTHITSKSSSSGRAEG